MRRDRSLLWSVPLAALLMAPSAFGFVAPQAAKEGFTGAPVGTRVVRPTLAPATAEAFANLPGATTVEYDVRSGAARVISGGKLAPGAALEAAATKESYVAQAMQWVNEHQDVLGVTPADLQLIDDSVLIDDDVQFFKFRVLRDGLVIDDASLDFRFKHGSLLQVASETYSEAKVDAREATSGLDRAAAAAVLGDATAAKGDAWRVVADEKGYHLVRVSKFDVTAQDGETFVVSVEAATGQAFEVRPTTYRLDGSARGNFYGRYYGEAPVNEGYKKLAMPFTGGQVTTDGQGNFFNAPAGAQPKLDGFQGPQVKVELKSGTKVVRDGGLVRDRWDVTFQRDAAAPVAEDKNMAQAMVFVHLNKIIDYARGYVQPAWFDRQLTANANLTSTCNAHWDGSTVNFYSSGSGCANTGLIADVMYHEWGHGLDENTGGIADGAYSEGFGDIMSLMMTHSNVLGIGFKLDGSPVRDLSPDKVYPRDAGEVHAEGLIIGSTFWDLFTALKDQYGEERAGDLISKYALKTIYTATKYTDVYNALLVVDDDDGDLSNKTPNYCIVNKAFAPHGLATLDEACNLASVDRFEVDDREGGNGNGVMEPGERVKLWLTARNAANDPVAGMTGTLALSGNAGVSVPDAALAWADIPARTAARSTKAATVDVGRDVACGTKVSARVALAAGARTATVTGDLLVGRLTGTAQAFDAAGLPLPINDNSTTSVSVNVDGDQWDATTGVQAVVLKIDARHTYVGDLSVKLTAPDGTVKEVFKGSGSNDDLHFDQDVTALFATVKGKGVWRIDVIDNAAQDTGTLDAVKLTVTPAKFLCE